jgi:hypothetical protein
VYRRYWHARPEVILAGTPDRMSAIKTTSNAVFDALVARRTNLAKQERGVPRTCPGDTMRAERARAT